MKVQGRAPTVLLGWSIRDGPWLNGSACRLLILTGSVAHIARFCHPPKDASRKRKRPRVDREAPGFGICPEPDRVRVGEGSAGERAFDSSLGLGRWRQCVCLCVLFAGVSG